MKFVDQCYAIYMKYMRRCISIFQDLYRRLTLMPPISIFTLNDSKESLDHGQIICCQHDIKNSSNLLAFVSMLINICSQCLALYVVVWSLSYDASHHNHVGPLPLCAVNTRFKRPVTTEHHDEIVTWISC